MLKKLNIAIVGGGKACYEILNVLMSDQFSHLVNVVGVADINPNAPGFKYAQKTGIFTTNDYHDLFQFSNVDIVLEITGQDEIKRAIAEEIPSNIYLIDHNTARIIWTLLEKRLLNTQRMLIEMKNFLQGTFDSIRDYILIVDKNFKIKEINSAFLKYLNISREEAIGKSCFKILSGSDNTCNACGEVCPVKEVFVTGRPSTKIHTQKKGQHTLYLSIGVYPIKNERGKVIYAIVVIRDITDAKIAAEELKKRHDELTTLHKITTTITSSIDLDKVLEICSQELSETFGAEVLIIYLVENNYTYLAYCQGVSKEDLPLFSTVEAIYIPPSEKQVTLLDAKQVLPNQPENLNCKSLIAIPLIASNEIVGIIEMGFKKEHHFDEQEMNFLQTLGYQIGIAVENAKLHEETKELSKNLQNKVIEQTKELEKSYKEIETFYHISQTVGEKNTFKEVFNCILPRVKEILPYKQVLPLVLTSDKESLFEMSLENLKNNLSLCEKCQRQIVKLLKNNSKKPYFTAKLHCWKRLTSYPFIIPISKEDEPIGGLILFLNNKKATSKDFRFVYIMLSQVSGVIKRIVQQEEKLKALKKQIISYSYGSIVGKDPKMLQIYRLIDDIAPTNATVLILGESGTGKELVARAIHAKSLRKNKPFVVINCSAYPQTLLESELFGYEKGAFTGAVSQKKGRFELANGGTVFLDEVGDIPPVSQVKLLRLLQFQEFERLGGNKTIKVDVRLIAATNKNLLEEVKKGNFREDLYYRLNVIPILLPPLRERKNDIPLLVEHFIKKLNEKENKHIKGVTPEVMRILMDYDWPGNVRELENTIEHAFVLTKGELIEKTALPMHLRGTEKEEKETLSFAENERRFLLKMLEECNWNKMRVAKKLNISRSTLYSKLKRYNLLDKKVSTS